MRRSRVTKPFLVAAGLVALMFAAAAVPLGAQPANTTHEHFGPHYDRAHEVTVNGVVQEVVTRHSQGSPFGMHLLITGENGLVDAHVGPYLAKDVREALHAGLPVQVTGAMQDLRGKHYLMVRELTLGGRTVIVRSQNGLLARPAHRNVGKAAETNGGAR